MECDADRLAVTVASLRQFVADRLQNHVAVAPEFGRRARKLAERAGAVNEGEGLLL